MAEIDWKAEAAMDPILRAMMRSRVPLTREHYIETKYGSEDMPEEWSEEHEAALPHPVQRHRRKE
jgi:hypothetical protein